MVHIGKPHKTPKEREEELRKARQEENTKERAVKTASGVSVTSGPESSRRKILDPKTGEPLPEGVLGTARIQTQGGTRFERNSVLTQEQADKEARLRDPNAPKFRRITDEEIAQGRIDLGPTGTLESPGRETIPLTSISPEREAEFLRAQQAQGQPLAVQPEEGQGTFGEEFVEGFTSPIDSAVNIIKEVIDIGFINEPGEKERADAVLAQLAGIVANIPADIVGGAIVGKALKAIAPIVAPVTSRLLRLLPKGKGVTKGVTSVTKGTIPRTGPERLVDQTLHNRRIDDYLRKHFRTNVGTSTAKQLYWAENNITLGKVWGVDVPIKYLIGGGIVAGGVATAAGASAVRVANLETSVVNQRETAGFIVQSVQAGELSVTDALEIFDEMEEYIDASDDKIAFARGFSVKSLVDKKNKEVETRLDKARTDLALRRRQVINIGTNPVQ